MLRKHQQTGRRGLLRLRKRSGTPQARRPSTWISGGYQPGLNWPHTWTLPRPPTVKLVVQVKLIPEPEVALALAYTLRTWNADATWLAEQAHALPSRTRAALRGSHYAALKERGLSAQPALHIIRKTADAYTTLKANLKAGNYGKKDSPRYVKAAGKPIRFRPDAAHSYDDRCLSWQMDAQTVSPHHRRTPQGHPFRWQPGRAQDPAGAPQGRE